jgi:hypothetical protein
LNGNRSMGQGRVRVTLNWKDSLGYSHVAHGIIDVTLNLV